MAWRRRVIYLAGIPVIAALLTFGGRFAWDRWVMCPILDYASTLDLGERERGEIAIGRFTVTNNGRGMLTLNDFSTSCSCAGVEAEVGGRFQRVQSILLPPKEQVELRVRVGVGARQGESQTVQVLFLSNDPTRPIGQMTAIVPRVKGGIYAQPATVVFGILSMQGQAKQLVNVYDGGTIGRKIDKVRSKQPERFQVRLIPIASDEPVQVHETAGRLIARLEVLPLTERHGTVDGEIEVCLANETRRPDLIPVVGEVVPDVECWPNTLVLPRRAGDRFLYSGEVLLRQRDGKPIHVEVEALPKEIAATVQSVLGQEDQKRLDVEWRPVEGGTSPQSQPLRIRLRVRTEGSVTTVEVPLLFAKGSP